VIFISLSSKNEKAACYLNDVLTIVLSETDVRFSFKLSKSITMSNEILKLLIVGLIGAALMIFGNYKHAQRIRLVASGIRTEGTVLSIEESFHDQIATYYPVISYTTLQNETFIKQYSIGVSNNTYKPGDSVSIIYDAKNNNEFIIDNQIAKLSGPIIAMIGGILILFSFLQYFVHPFN